MDNLMKAIVINEFGGPEGLQVQEMPVPEVSGKHVLIRVRFAGINRPDILQRKGHYPAPKGVVADIPGLEVSGEVVACGPEVTQWKSGDRVCALLAGGGYAEYALAHEGQCLSLDPVVSGPTYAIPFEVGGALPETLFTVWYNVFQVGKLRKGQELLLHGGSGGIGTTAIQLATLRGAKVYTTAGSDERARACETIGAAAGINYKTVDFVEHWKYKKFDVIVDSIAGPYFQKNLQLLAPDGYLVHINCTGGRKVELDILSLMQNRHHITGSTMRARTDAFKQTVRDAIASEVWPEVARAKFAPVLQEVLPAQEAAEAHRMLESQGVFGKILLAW